MSDYEGEGWNPIDLTTKQYQATTAVYNFTDQVVPRGKFVPDASSRDPPNARRNKQLLSARPAKTFHPVLQNIRPRTHHGTGGRAVEQPVPAAHNDQELESYNLFLARPDTPDDIYELDIAWKGLLRAIPETNETKSRDVARNNLHNISLFSEAFIKTPDPNSMQIEIWGDKEQCQKAKARLQAWEGHLRSTGKRPSHKIWAKEHAFDGRKEDRKRHELWQELEDQALRDADDSEFYFEAYLVWPQDYDLEEYIQKHEPNTLKEIGKAFVCRFKHERKIRPRFTKIQAQTEGNLLSAYQRLINLAKEMIAQKNRGTHGNFCRFPSSEAHRTEVVTQQIANSSKAPYRPILMGLPMADKDADEWLTFMKSNERHNRKEIENSVDSFIRTLYLSENHIRLRVSFGDLLLYSFPKAKDGTLTFGFDEFLGMIQGHRTEFHEPLLQYYHGDMALLADELSKMPEFQYPEDGYRQVFEFKGTDVTNRLRLEIEMQRGYDFEEPQVCGQRWLTFKTYGRNENVLGLRVLDFERPGYMFRADSYDLFTNDNIIKDLEAFRSAVSFKPSKEGIKAYPKLRSTFPGHEKLVAVTEYTSVKFQFKDTDGIIEVRREDTYMQDTGRPSKLPDKTRFELFYYYPEWDNLLGELSNIKPGEDISWHRDITTFFPKYMDPDRPRSLPKGFKAFMKEVYEIQDLLRDALTNLAAQIED